MPIQKWSDQIWIVTLSNEPALSEDLINVKHEAEHAKPTPHLVLDMSGVEHVNSSNLSQLLRLRKVATDHNTKLRLVGVSDSMWVVFMTTGLDKVFDFIGDLPTALASLQID